jgi:cobalt transporter subunit CbtA
MLTSGLIAGCLAGLLAALLHFALIQPLLLTGERYETGELVHFGGVAAGEASGEHAEVSEHGDTAEPGALQRNGMTILFTALIYGSYGLVLAAAFGVAVHFGREIRLRDGILWGLAGYAAFQLSPAMGLAPELPGTQAADLALRQAWWLGTVAATALGLAVLAYGRGWGAIAAAVVLLALPHVIGAPVPENYSGVAPAELGAEFAARVLGVGLVTWAVMGWLAARLWTDDAVT